MPFALNAMTLIGLSTLAGIFEITIFFYTASLSSVTICFTAVTTFNVSLLDKLGACTDRPVF
jgi:hypothetical protein